MSATVAPPSALPPRRPSLVHRLRARRAAAVPGVTVEGLPRLGRGVVLDLDAAARVVLEDRCVLMDGCRIHARGAAVRIGAGAVLGARCVILAHERIEVGARCLLADGVVLVDFTHDAADVERPVRSQPLLTAPVRLGEASRVGPATVVERGTVLPAGSAVGAHRVVTRA